MLGPCSQCGCALGVWNGRREWLLCANYPGHEGGLTHVSGTGIVVDCRKFCPRREVPAGPAEGEAVRYIPLGDGRAAIVDAADFAWLSQYRWRAGGGRGGYPYARIGGRDVFMHRLIMNPAVGKVVDHANGNPWDNRRGNLRECTQAQNVQNRRKAGGTSRFKGVFWDKRRGKWAAAIKKDGRITHLGYFASEIDAAEAYDRKARELFGAFACLNFPDGGNIVRVSGRILAHSGGHAALTTVAVRHRQEGASCRCHPGCKSEARKTKCETTAAHRNLKPKVQLGSIGSFGSLRHLGCRHCFQIRASQFEFSRPPAWATGPP